MFCTNCGKQLVDTAMFCTQCGKPIKHNLTNEKNNIQNQINNSQEISYLTPHSGNVPVNNKPLKKNKGKLLIIAGISSIVLVACGVGGYFLYQNHIVKQADTVLAHHKDGNYEEAVEIYEKYSGKKDEFDSKVYDGLSILSKQIQEKFINEEIDYNTAKGQLHTLEEYNMSKLDKEVKEISEWIDKIKVSRENYKEGKIYYEQGDLSAALEKYRLVISEDSKYYELAVNEITRIEQELTEIEEQESLNEIRMAALSEAEAFEFTSLKYEQTYYDQGKEIMTIYLEVPQIVGDYSAYAYINSIFSEILTKHIESAEELHEFLLSDADITDEYFYAYSYDLGYNILYNDNGILCIILNGYEYSGGVHGFPIKETYTFDLATGNVLKISDLITTDDYTFASYAFDEFSRMIEEAETYFWDGAPNTVIEDLSNLNNVDFYVDDNGICVYYFPYELASYADGFIEIKIPYSGNEWMFKFLQ